jgi:Ca2+-binding EF-hand superfamily protein
VPLTPLRTRKIEKLFSTLDLNRDGIIDRGDFLRRVERFAELRGWTEESPQYRRNAAYSLEEWRNLRETADVDEDGTVTREEYLRFGEIFLEDRDAVRAYARGDIQLLFDAMDTDGDERVSAAEYREYLDVCGIDPAGADAFFAHADVNRDGRMTRAEMAHAFEEFLVSEDPAAGGNFLFGAID